MIKTNIFLKPFYRITARLSVMEKVFEKISTIRLQGFLDNTLLSDHHLGFRPGRSTTDPIIRLRTDVTVALNSKRCVTATFLDIKRRFDKA